MLIYEMAKSIKDFRAERNHNLFRFGNEVSIGDRIDIIEGLRRLAALGRSAQKVLDTIEAGRQPRGIFPFIKNNASIDQMRISRVIFEDSQPHDLEWTFPEDIWIERAALSRDGREVNSMVCAYLDVHTYNVRKKKFYTKNELVKLFKVNIPLNSHGTYSGDEVIQKWKADPGDTPVQEILIKGCATAAHVVQEQNVRFNSNEMSPVVLATRRAMKEKICASFMPELVYRMSVLCFERAEEMARELGWGRHIMEQVCEI